MAKLNFQDALNVKLKDVEAIPLIPQGTYVTTVSKHPTFGAVGEGGRYETCVFILKVLQPTDDVDVKELKDYGDVSKAFIRHQFMFDTEDENAFSKSHNRLIKFLEDHLQIDGAANKELKQVLAESVNHQCLATIGWRPDKNDPEIMYAEIKSTAPAA